MAVHEKVRRFTCKHNGCRFAGLSHSGLWKHLKTVHNEGSVIECDHPGCSYKSRRDGNVKTHKQQVHQKIKPYSCHLCTYACWIKGDMRKHVSRHEAEGHDVSHCPRCQLLFQNRRLQSVKAMAETLVQDQEVETRSNLSEDLFSLHSSLHLMS